MLSIYIRNFFLIFFCLFLFSCTENDEDQQLLNQIDKLVVAIEEKNISQIDKTLSQDFSAGKQFNRTQFLQFVKRHFNYHKNITLIRTKKNIKRTTDKADVTSELLLLGAKGWLPERGQKYFIESQWKKENQEWVMNRLRWRIK